MATTQYEGIFTYLDEHGNTTQLFPKTKNGGIPIVAAESTDGAAYTATVDGVTALVIGQKITIIPAVVSTIVTPTLNVNGLGAKYIRMAGTYNTTTCVNGPVVSWLSAGKPVTVTWDGTQWETDIQRPTASSISGTVAIANGGTGASTLEAAQEALMIHRRPIAVEGNSYASLADFWTAYESYIHSNNRNVFMRFKDTSGWTGIGGWHRAWVSSLNRLGNGSNQVGGAILSLRSEANTVYLRIGHVKGGATDTSDLSVTWEYIPYGSDFDELKKFVADGKLLLATSISAYVSTASDATFDTLNTNMNRAFNKCYNDGVNAGGSAAAVGTATDAQVLSGYTFSNSSGSGLKGSMANYSSNVQTITPTASQTGTVVFDIADGYHTKIKVNSTNTYNAGYNAGYKLKNETKTATNIYTSQYNDETVDLVFSNPVVGVTAFGHNRDGNYLFVKSITPLADTDYKTVRVVLGHAHGISNLGDNYTITVTCNTR